MIEDQQATPSADHIKSVFERYGELMTAGDYDAITALYAPDAVISDPVDGPDFFECKGHELIRKWYRDSFADQGGAIEMTLDSAVRVAGRLGAAAYIARTVHSQPVMRVETLDVMSFNDEGLITSMKAYWGRSNMQFEG
jgi:steroid Delta-isomerase